MLWRDVPDNARVLGVIVSNSDKEDVVDLGKRRDWRGRNKEPDASRPWQLDACGYEAQGVVELQKYSENGMSCRGPGNVHLHWTKRRDDLGPELGGSDTRPVDGAADELGAELIRRYGWTP